MYLYPYKIFTISKDKRTCNIEQGRLVPVGIYDIKKVNYNEAREIADRNDAKISVLLGDITDGVNLICLDLDDCFTPDGKIEPLTKEFLKEFSEDEYEVSSSGEGIHIYVLTKLSLETFIVKEMEGCKSFECYTNKRHIVTTTFDFENTNLQVGKHDKFLERLYEKKEIKRSQTSMKDDIKIVFQGEELKGTNTQIDNQLFFRANGEKRTPVQDMYQLRGLGYKDPMIIECIDACPDAVDQSAHDAKLLKKLVYYFLDFDVAWDMAKKTNYYKAKDDFHKRKFDNPVYKERTRKFVMGGWR